MLTRLQEVVLLDQHDKWWWDIGIDGNFIVSETRRWVLMDRIPTHSNLVDRGIDVPSSLCPINDLEIEQLDHIFMQCDMATRTWSTLR